MWQNKKLQNNGYTIVESLIFLAVSAIIAIGALTIVSGRQSVAEFREGVSKFEAQIRDIGNDVASGYFPNPGISCNPATTPLTLTPDINPSQVQGDDDRCVFVGRVIQFNATEIHVYSALGRTYKTLSSDPVSDIYEATPTLVATPAVDVTNTIQVPSALEIKWVRQTVPASGTLNRAGIAFFSTFGNSGSDASGLNSIRAEIAPVPGDISNNKTTFISNFYSLYLDASREPEYREALNTTDGYMICANSLSTDDFVVFRIGARGSDGSSTTTEISGGVCPA
jgi:type II secretory pathway pseudopilin PulG